MGLDIEVINILIVDGNNVGVEALSIRLTNIYGPAANIVIASSYEQAADLRRRPFDVYLLDHTRDAIPALQLLTRLVPEGLPGPVIMIVAEDAAIVALEGADYGIADCLKKSEITDSLLKRTIHYCRSRHADLRRISYLTRHDRLTHLLSRATFRERFQALLGDSVNDLDNCYLMQFDIDNFKSINDSYGDHIGDQILLWVATSLTEALRDSDIIARLGGDEFVAIVRGVSRNRITGLANKLLATFRKPCLIGGQQFRVSISFGVVRVSQGGGLQDELMVMADQAMYHAKETGRDNYAFYDSSIASGERKGAQAAQELRRAMENNELYLVYEPQCRLHDGAVIGAEALVRWRHPEKGLIYPDEFIPVAEATGLIVSLGRDVLSDALLAYSRWVSSGVKLAETFKISVNVSPTQLLTSDFVDFVLSELKRRKLPGACLQVELTEHVMLSESQYVHDELTRLCRSGVTVAIDDFGSGYSSFKRMAEMNFYALKLDKSYVLTMLDKPMSLALVESFVYMAHKLKLTTIAEGVETKEQMELLANMGCDIGQGWLFGRPNMDSDAFLLYLGTRLAN